MSEGRFKFKIDCFTRKRGTPAMLRMTCAECGAYIMAYQKDGPGPLLRCYLDRIYHPPHLAGKHKDKFDKQKIGHLVCPQCTIVIGSPILYEKENRPAFHLRPTFFKITKIKDLITGIFSDHSNFTMSSGD